jgi:hypothetical protein
MHCMALLDFLDSPLYWHIPPLVVVLYLSICFARPGINEGSQLRHVLYLNDRRGLSARQEQALRLSIYNNLEMLQTIVLSAIHANKKTSTSRGVAISVKVSKVRLVSYMLTGSDVISRINTDPLIM